MPQALRPPRQAADGSAAQKVAAGLLADTGTRVFFQQAPDQIPDARDLLGLSDVEAALLPDSPADALWRVGDRAAVVQHILGPNDHWTNTDQSMSA
ncbi:MAG: hypothetical protein R2715_16690 [Ilumatobacteraceae bacterium]